MPFLRPRRLEALNEIRISGNRIRQNYDVFTNALPNAAVFPVLKSNAYGHGLKHIAKILDKTDAPYFALDSYAEALELKRVTTKDLLVLGANPPANFCHFDFGQVAVAIGNFESLYAVAAHKKTIRVHLKLNTGMNRQGFDSEELPEVLRILKKHRNLTVEGVFSHLADADNVNNEFTHKQEDCFGKMLDSILQAGFSPRYIHLGATAGCLKLSDKRINSCRVGIGIYGFNPLLPADPFYQKLAALQPALSLISTITNVHRVTAGEKVSYNCTYTVEEGMDIGVIPLGYFEALDRRLSNCGFLKFEHNFYPIAGRVCMNLTCFACPHDSISVGDTITVISDDPADKNSVENIAKMTGTIPYEVLTRLERSIRRTVIK